MNTSAFYLLKTATSNRVLAAMRTLTATRNQALVAMETVHVKEGASWEPDAGGSEKGTTGRAALDVSVRHSSALKKLPSQHQAGV